jgi:hypothetical protein
MVTILSEPTSTIYLYAKSFLHKVPVTEIKSFLSNGNSPLAYGMKRFAPTKGGDRIDIQSFTSNHDLNDKSPIYLQYSMLDLIRDKEVVLERATGSEERDLTCKFVDKEGMIL